jgi:hypothetical protein
MNFFENCGRKRTKVRAAGGTYGKEQKNTGISETDIPGAASGGYVLQ